jgi:hypothetical protein
MWLIVTRFTALHDNSCCPRTHSNREVSYPGSTCRDRFGAFCSGHKEHGMTCAGEKRFLNLCLTLRNWIER